jgi:hypothetical protein
MQTAALGGVMLRGLAPRAKRQRRQADESIEYSCDCSDRGERMRHAKRRRPSWARLLFELPDQRLFDHRDNHIRVSVGAGRHYILTTNWNARDLVWTENVAIRSTTSWICTGNGLGVELIGGRPRRTYPIQGIEREPEQPEKAAQQQ